MLYFPREVNLSCFIRRPSGAIPERNRRPASRAGLAVKASGGPRTGNDTNYVK